MSSSWVRSVLDTEERWLRSLGIRALQGDYNYKEDRNSLFSVAAVDRARSNDLQLQQRKFRLGMNFLTTRVVRLPRDRVGSPSVQIFQSRLRGHVAGMAFVRDDPALGAGLD